jgi:hypothetical protein
MEKKRTIQNEQGGAQNDIWLARAVRERIQPELHAASAQSHAHASLRERESIRKAIACTILVNFGTTYAIASNILDISLTGAYVDLDAAGAQMGDVVEVVISFAYQERQIEHRISATIVRLQSKGVGMKFEAYDNQVYTDLVNLLYAA